MNRIAPEWEVRKHRDCVEYSGIFAVYGSQGKMLSRVFGLVIEWRGLPVDVYIFNPRRSLRRHPHGRCLQLLKPGSRWYKLHWERPAKTFDEARAYIEQILAEAWPPPLSSPVFAIRKQGRKETD
jgi:hypothetical protein